MRKVLFRRSNGVYVGHEHPDSPDNFDPSLIVSVALPDIPDKVTKRWDGGTGIRSATAQEIADFDEAELGERATNALDTNLAFRSLIHWIADREGIPPGTAMSEIIAKFKQLASP